MALNFANNNSLSAITTLPASISGGGMTLISEQTASSSSTISFTSGIDSTYDSYVFKFYDIHPSTEYAHFSFQADTGTNTSYNQTITSTVFTSTHNEADTEAIINYQVGSDQAQGTGFQHLTDQVEADNDSCSAGTLTIYNPSSSTFVKHFIARVQHHQADPSSREYYVAGYFNTITPLTRVRFKFSSGNIDSGVIKLYGIS